MTRHRNLLRFDLANVGKHYGISMPMFNLATHAEPAYRYERLGCSDFRLDVYECDRFDRRARQMGASREICVKSGLRFYLGRN